MADHREPAGWVKKRRWRRALAIAVAGLPTHGLRKAVYRLLFGYRFGVGTKVAFGVYIAVDRFECGDGVQISRWNRFYGPIAITIGRNSFIGPRNQVMCGESVVEAWAANRNYGRALIVGDDCLINEGHLFDVVGTVLIEEGSWIAGFRSQFVTHGASVTDRDIRIGPHCFLGTAVLMSPGSAIGPRTLLAMGSVVAGKFSDSDVIIGGVPAKVLRSRRAEDKHQFEKVW